MGLKQKQAQLRHKEYFEEHLKNRLTFLSGKGIDASKADKDPIVRKLKAGLRTANRRLRLIAAHDKRTEEMARIKAEKAAAPKEEKEPAKPEKSKKGPEEGKAKRPKAEKKPAPPKEKGAEKEPKPAEAPQPEAPKEEKPQ
jgi:hypothetical protein